MTLQYVIDTDRITALSYVSFTNRTDEEMNSATMDRPVARSEKNDQRIDFRAPSAWTRRVEIAARKKGIGFSAYIRLAVSEKLDEDGIDAEPPASKQPKSK